MLGKGLLKGLGITLQHLFEKDITIQYPEQMPFLQERFRGHLYQEFAKCIVCGICVKSCPNNVLSLEEGRDNQSKKKILLTFTIEHQYCMFCNICVENCPANCLHFNHDFELARYRREDTKTVYERAQEMAGVVIDTPVAAEEDKEKGGAMGEKPAAAREGPSQEPKENKKNPAEAMLNALLKNPAKVLAKYLPDAEQAALVAAVLQKDEKKAKKVAELMISDKDKAQKVIEAMVKSEAKAAQTAREASDRGDGGENNEP
ncbi:MAG: 4Fe-4S dicluster domain-containing protein [Syntrophomonadaceae bacterium]|nr:4Fe-4S dicluster domain-containing protein [Syntrophomonadaceae bacterium]